MMVVPDLPGESPPPPPRACFGRDGILEEIIGLADNLEPIALIGAGGIGKTSIALTVLHHHRIKQRFGGNRRFIRCDQFPATLSHFLSRLSKVTGAGIENPEDLAALLPFLSSKEILIVLDNAESILDPQGANSREIYASVEELCRLDTISLCITSRISTIPPDCEILEVPTLSMEPAREVFYRIYKRRERSDPVDDILRKLDFHPLSITLLATVAHQNKWDSGRLIREWEGQRTEVLQTEHQTSLAATIELSLASPFFEGLGPNARGLLEVVAFYPQGVNERNLDWLFPTIPNITRIFDKFCMLSLTYQSNGFITMLAPLRDHLRPKDPKSSPLLCKTKECYLARMSAELIPTKPGFKDAQWIASEDVNVEHLLDVFTSVDPDSDDIWDACANFMDYLSWHKPRVILLGPKLEALPDDHRSKPRCLFNLGLLSETVGNIKAAARHLNYALKLESERRDDDRIAHTLVRLSGVNRMSDLHKEGISQAKEALEIYERLGDAAGRTKCLNELARCLHADGQLDAAEEAAVRSCKLSQEEGDRYESCTSHRALGRIYNSKGEREKAIQHYETALGIASSFNWDDQLFWIHFSMAELFFLGDDLEGARTHIKQAELHSAHNLHRLGGVPFLHAQILYKQHRLEDATYEIVRALEMFEKTGASQDAISCIHVLLIIERATRSGAASSRTDLSGKLLSRHQSHRPAHSSLPADDTSPGTPADAPLDGDRGESSKVMHPSRRILLSIASIVKNNLPSTS